MEKTNHTVKEKAGKGTRRASSAVTSYLPQVEALVKDRVGRLELKAMLVKLVFALLLLLLLGVMLLRLRLLTLLL